MGSIFLACSHEKHVPPKPQGPMSVCTGHTCLPFAKVWIPWHHKPRTDLTALPKIPQHVRLDPPPQCPTSRQMTNSDRRRARERNQVFIPYAATWMPHSFPGQALPFWGALYLSLDGIRDMIRQGLTHFLILSSSSFSIMFPIFLFKPQQKKNQGCLGRLVIKPSQQSPVFLSRHGLPTGYRNR